MAIMPGVNGYNPYSHVVSSASPATTTSPEGVAPPSPDMKDEASPLSWLFDYAYGPMETAGQNYNNVVSSIGEKENQYLESIRKYDPNARWEYIDNSQSSNEGGTVNPNTWHLVFDQTKLPDAGGTRTGKTPFSSEGSPMGIQRIDQNFKGELLNPDLVWNSPYGRITDSRNIKDEQDLFWKIAPMIPMLAAGIPGFLAAGGLSGGLGSLGALMSSGNPAFSAINGLLSSASRGNLNLGSMAGMLGNMAGLPPALTTLARLGLDLTGNNSIPIGGKRP